MIEYIYYLILCTAVYPSFDKSPIPEGGLVVADGCRSMPIVNSEKDAALQLWEFKKTHGDFHHAELWRFDGVNLERVDIPKIHEIDMREKKRPPND